MVTTMSVPSSSAWTRSPLPSQALLFLELTLPPLTESVPVERLPSSSMLTV